MFNEVDEAIEVTVWQTMDVNLYYNEKSDMWHATDEIGVIEVGETKEEAIEKVQDRYESDGFETEVDER
jgi:threonyl-tRNA synthetase